jgi:hypothetical protein
MDFGAIPNIPPTAHVVTTAIRDREPGKNHYFRSRQNEHGPQPPAENMRGEEETDEPGHTIDIRI